MYYQPPNPLASLVGAIAGAFASRSLNRGRRREEAEDRAFRREQQGWEREEHAHAQEQRQISPYLGAADQLGSLTDDPGILSRLGQFRSGLLDHSLAPTPYNHPAIHEQQTHATAAAPHLSGPGSGPLGLAARLQGSLPGSAGLAPAGLPAPAPSPGLTPDLVARIRASARGAGGNAGGSLAGLTSAFPATHFQTEVNLPETAPHALAGIVAEMAGKTKREQAMRDAATRAAMGFLTDLPAHYPQNRAPIPGLLQRLGGGESVDLGKELTPEVLGPSVGELADQGRQRRERASLAGRLVSGYLQRVKGLDANRRGLASTLFNQGAENPEAVLTAVRQTLPDVEGLDWGAVGNYVEHGGPIPGFPGATALPGGGFPGLGAPANGPQSPAPTLPPPALADPGRAIAAAIAARMAGATGRMESPNPFARLGSRPAPVGNPFADVLGAPVGPAPLSGAPGVGTSLTAPNRPVYAGAVRPLPSDNSLFGPVGSRAGASAAAAAATGRLRDAQTNRVEALLPAEVARLNQTVAKLQSDMKNQDALTQIRWATLKLGQARLSLAEKSAAEKWLGAAFERGIKAHHEQLLTWEKLRSLSPEQRARVDQLRDEFRDVNARRRDAEKERFRNPFATDTATEALHDLDQKAAALKQELGSVVPPSAPGPQFAPPVLPSLDQIIGGMTRYTPAMVQKQVATNIAAFEAHKGRPATERERNRISQETRQQMNVGPSGVGGY